MNQLAKRLYDPFAGFFPSIFNDDFFDEARNRFESRGLKNIIQRPHDIVNVKDKDGNVVGQKLSLVYTPFKKDQIKVTVDKDVLSVAIGDEKKEEEKNDNGDVIYRGISAQSTRFSLKIADKVDKKEIKAKAEDGMLHIDLPFIREDEKEPSQIEIAIQ